MRRNDSSSPLVGNGFVPRDVKELSMNEVAERLENFGFVRKICG